MASLGSLDGPAPAVIAHRGASVRAAENTIAAFRIARVERADAVEFDVRRTRDGGYVVHHGAVLASGDPIATLTTSDLRRAAPHVPTFDEAMAACTGMWVDVEVKNAPDDPDFDPEAGTAAAVARWIAARRRYHDVLVSSFDPASVTAVRRIDATIATGLLTGPELPPGEGLHRAQALGCRALLPYAGLLADGVADRIVETASGLGLWIIAWTVDDPPQVRRLAAARVSGIITNDPAVTRSALRGS